MLPASVGAQQRINLTFLGGMSNYYGDLQEKRFTSEGAGASFGANINAVIVPKFAVRVGLLYGKMSADDKTSTRPLNRARNLNFTSSVQEFSVVAEYSLMDITKKNFTPYIFAGIAAFHFNPYTHDSTGVKYYLQPLSTEGEGLSIYPDRKPYSRIAFSIPMGGGIRFRITPKTVIGYEFGFRPTTTDYLDDVSNHYADPAVLLAERGPKAVELSYRAGEIDKNAPPYPVNGLRGGPKYKDWYYFHGITVSIGLSDKEGKLFGKSPLGNTDCPRSVL